MFSPPKGLAIFSKLRDTSIMEARPDGMAERAKSF
jgi:hypothetical protein